MADVGEDYAERVHEFLLAVCDEARSVERGLACDGPADMTDEEHRWSVLVRQVGGDEEDGVDVTVTVLESEVRGDEEGGVNFGLDVVSYGGAIVGGFVPYNYTPDVWVDAADSDAVEARWRLFDGGLDPSAVVDSIQEYWGREQAAMGAPDPPAAPAVSADDLKAIDRHRASLGLGPIDPGAGWTPDELRDMARSIRETGRMTNPVSALKRRLMPPR